MRQRKSIVGPSLLLAIMGALAVSQLGAVDHKTDQNPWESLARLAKGTSVLVEYGRSEFMEGRLVAVSGDKLTIRVHHGRSRVREEVTLSRSDVLKVTARRFSPTKTALFSAVGAGLGAMAGGYKCTKSGGYVYPYGSSCLEGHWRSSAAIEIGAGVGAAAMGLLGALAVRDYKEVYARPPELTPRTPKRGAPISPGLQRGPTQESQAPAPPDAQAQPQQTAAEPQKVNAFWYIAGINLRCLRRTREGALDCGGASYRLGIEPSLPPNRLLKNPVSSGLGSGAL